MAGMTPEDTPATKNDLLALEERLVERMRDMQSEIIRVFMEFQERNEIRYGAQEKAVRKGRKGDRRIFRDALGKMRLSPLRLAIFASAAGPASSLS
jgi:hypothetical protein